MVNRTGVKGDIDTIIVSILVLNPMSKIVKKVYKFLSGFNIIRLKYKGRYGVRLIKILFKKKFTWNDPPRILGL